MTLSDADTWPAVAPHNGVRDRTTHCQSTRAGVLGPIWRRWMFIAVNSLGACEAQLGIVPCERLVTQVMEQPPYEGAERIF